LPENKYGSPGHPEKSVDKIFSLPSRDVHQAMDDISWRLRRGKLQAIEADIMKYSDTIVHDELIAHQCRSSFGRTRVNQGM